jgi:hypothetical protein
MNEFKFSVGKIGSNFFSRIYIILRSITKFLIQVSSLNKNSRDGIKKNFASH